MHGYHELVEKNDDSNSNSNGNSTDDSIAKSLCLISSAVIAGLKRLRN